MSNVQDDDIFDFEDEEPLFEEEEEEIEFEAEAGPRQNRAFLIGVAVLAALFVISLIAVILIILSRPTGPGPIDLTNPVIMMDLFTTQTLEAEQTAAAQAQAAEQTAVAQTQIAAEATRQAIAAATATWLAQITDTPTATDTPTPTEAVALLESPTPTVEALVTLVTATPGFATPTPGEAPLATPAAMPVTGIADDLGMGGSLFVAGIAAVGLLAVMFVARRLRTSSYDEDDEA